MKTIAGVILIASMITGFIVIGEQPAGNEPPLEVQWASYIYENTSIQHVRNPPYEISGLPRQMEGLGLDGDRIVYGRKFASFTKFKESFEEALANNPVESEALSPWEESWHQGVSVQTRVFRIEDKGIVVSFYSPNVIFADLGAYDESLEIKNNLVEMNR